MPEFSNFLNEKAKAQLQLGLQAACLSLAITYQILMKILNDILSVFGISYSFGKYYIRVESSSKKVSVLPPLLCFSEHLLDVQGVKIS